MAPSPMSPPVLPPQTLFELLEHHHRRFALPGVLFRRAEGRWIGISSAEFLDQVRRATLGLYAHGIRPGDRVGLLGENSPDWVVADYAITSLGAITVPLYTTQAPEQILAILHHAAVRGLFISTEGLFERVREVLPALAIPTVVRFAPSLDGEGTLDLVSLQREGEALHRQDPGLFRTLGLALEPESVASIIYTSGTTGEPKGVVLRHGNLAANVFDASRMIDWSGEGQAALSFLPLSHIFERTLVNIYLFQGIPVHFAESLETLARDMAEVRPTLMSTVPRLLERLYERIRDKGADFRGLKRIVFGWSIWLGGRYDARGKNGLLFRLQQTLLSRLVYVRWRAAMGGRLRFLISGGAALPPHLARTFWTAGIPVLQGYGLTETSPVISVNPLEANRIGSVGRLIPRLELRFTMDGEILVRGPGVMKEYYREPEATAACFEGGWFRTGDVGHMDSDGYLYLTERKRDLLKSSLGKFIAPAPIEANLAASPYVEFASLVGEGRRFVVALLFPHFPKLEAWALAHAVPSADRRALLAHPEVQRLYQSVVDQVNGSLNHWERVVRFLLVEEVPTVAGGELTPTLKVRRRVVLEKHRAAIEAIYRSTHSSHDLGW